MKNASKKRKNAAMPDAISDQWNIQNRINLLPRTPLPEVTELFGEDGWRQWDLAVKLLDYSHLEKTGISVYNISLRLRDDYGIGLY